MQREHIDSDFCTTKGKLVFDARKSAFPKKDDATRYRSACFRLSLLVPRKIRLGGNSKTLGLEDERTAGIRLCSTEACSTVSCSETQSRNAIPKRQTR